MMPTRKHVVPVVMLVLLVFGGAPRAAERVALVIGNAAYEHTMALRNPGNDAADVARALGGLGFEVIEGIDLDKPAFEGKLREFARAARGAEVTLFFYAGHGLQVEGENYLVPTDAKLAEEVDLRLEAFELAAFLGQMRGQTNLVFLDACRDNPLARTLARSMGPTRSSAIGRGLGRVETASGTLIAYATQPGNVADDGEGRNSPFTAALLAHITTPGLSVNDLLTSVTDAVVTGTAGRQQPWTHSSLRKPFFFQPPPTGSSVPAQAAREAYAAAERLGTLAAFQVVVDRFPGSAEAEQARTRIAGLEAGKASTEVELLFWESVKDSGHAADLQAYLDRYPGGAYEALARNRLGRLEDGPAEAGPTEPAVTAAPGRDASSVPVPVEAKFWAMVEGSDVASDLEAYLEHYPDGVYAPLARLRLAQLGRERSAPPSASGSAVAAPGVSVSLLAPEETEASLGLERVERRRIQLGLLSLGYGPGPVDGLFGTRTREAIRRYQAAKGFESTGYLTANEAQALVALGEEAVRAADDAAFSRAKELNTVAGYEAYLARGGRHEAEARRLLALVPQPKEVGEVFRDCAECPELVVVPSGSFVMGSPESEAGRDDDEGPLHRVEIAGAFAVGVHEVTFREWDACRRAGGCSNYSNDFGWGRGSRPVIDVSWADAKEYVRWLSRETGERYRLLSEAQWEYVARAGTRTRFHWGDEADRGRANCDGCGSRWDDESTALVGSFPANAFGLHDVHGNVWEWVEDCAHGSYVGAPGDGRAWTAGGDCGKRVLRGGSWNYEPRYVRSASRRSVSVTVYRNDDVGFRVARTLD